MNNRWFRIGLRVLLVVSLLANAAVVGYVLQLRNLAAEVGLQDARIPRDVRREYLARARDNDALLEQTSRLGEARRALKATADAEVYDAEAVARHLQEIRAITTELQTVSQGVLAEAFEAVAAREGRLGE